MTPLFPMCTYRGYYCPLMDLDPLRSGYSTFNPAAFPPHFFSQSSRSGSPSGSTSSSASTRFGLTYIEDENIVRTRTERYRRSYIMKFLLRRYVQGAGTWRVGELCLPTTIPEFLQSSIMRCYCCGRWVVWLFAMALQKYRRRDDRRWGRSCCAL